MRARMDGLRGEAQLLAMAMLVCFAGFLSNLPKELARVEPDARVQAVGWLFVGAMFFGPLLLMGLAAASRLIAKAFGGQGNWQYARLALLWALILAMPLLILGHLGLGWLAGIGFAGLWALTLSEAEAFEKPILVFAAILLVPALLSLTSLG